MRHAILARSVAFLAVCIGADLELTLTGPAVRVFGGHWHGGMSDAGFDAS